MSGKTFFYGFVRKIRYVLGAAEAGSFYKASEKLFVSQPSLKSSVHDLEYEIGLQIFNRTSRGITLTERGRQFCSDAKKLYGDFEKLRETYAKKEQ